MAVNDLWGPSGAQLDNHLHCCYQRKRSMPRKASDHQATTHMALEPLEEHMEGSHLQCRCSGPPREHCPCAGYWQHRGASPALLENLVSVLDAGSTEVHPLCYWRTLSLCWMLTVQRCVPCPWVTPDSWRRIVNRPTGFRAFYSASGEHRSLWYQGRQQKKCGLSGLAYSES